MVCSSSRRRRYARPNSAAPRTARGRWSHRSRAQGGRRRAPADRSADRGRAWPASAGSRRSRAGRARTAPANHHSMPPRTYRENPGQHSAADEDEQRAAAPGHHLGARLGHLGWVDGVHERLLDGWHGTASGGSRAGPAGRLRHEYLGARLRFGTDDRTHAGPAAERAHRAAEPVDAIAHAGARLCGARSSGTTTINQRTASTTTVIAGDSTSHLQSHESHGCSEPS